MFFSAITVTVLVLAFSGMRVAQEYQRGVVFRLGRFTGLRGPGLYWIIPLGIERAVTIDTRTRTVSAEQQETITRDSVTVKVNAVLWYRIVDAGKSVIAVTDAPAAVYQLALTSLRNIIGQHDLDEVLQERNKINDLLKENIAGSTLRWGLEVERFEMKDVELPDVLEEAWRVQPIIMDYEAFRALAYEYDNHRNAIGPVLGALLDKAASIPSEEYDAARRLTRRARHAANELLEGHFILTPSAPGAAPHGHLTTGPSTFNRLWTSMGTPCVNVAGINDSDGMPLGVQIVGRFGRDRATLEAASFIENVIARQR